MTVCKNVPEKEAVMFTGIVEETGTIKKIEKGTSSGRLTVEADKVLQEARSVTA